MDDKTILGCIGGLVVIGASLVVASIINGWVLSILWSWFFVPIFEVPPLTILQAIGISMVVTYLTRHSIKGSDSGSSKSKDWADLIAQLVGEAVAAPLLTLVMGWIIFSLM